MIRQALAIRVLDWVQDGTNCNAAFADAGQVIDLVER